MSDVLKDNISTIIEVLKETELTVVSYLKLYRPTKLVDSRLIVGFTDKERRLSSILSLKIHESGDPMDNVYLKMYEHTDLTCEGLIKLNGHNKLTILKKHDNKLSGFEIPLSAIKSYKFKNIGITN